MEIIISISALIVSVIAIIKTSRDGRKQISIAKTEEIYELTISLYSRYATIRDLQLYLTRYSSERSPKLREIFRKEYFEYRNECEKANLYQDTYAKVFRLNVLANAYSKKEIKIEILAFTNLMVDILEQAYRNKRVYYEDSYKMGFPNQINVSKFIDGLESKFIDEINMVNDKISQEELKRYCAGTFRKKLGINN